MKKALKLFLYILLGIILLGTVISYISYSNYWAKDPEAEVDSTYLDYYHESYEDCRNAFVECSLQLAEDFDSVQTGKFYVPSETDNDLTIDWCYIPAQEQKDKLLILTSGLHGIEGYTGSAIQLMFIEKILVPGLPDNMGVLLLHGLNPYGFKYYRKVTENNVDLNRNCVTGNAMFDIKNEGYGKLTGLLMPAKKVNLYNLRNQFFYLVAIYKIIRESMPVLRQAALQGQYDYNKGIYYGGRAYEPQIDTIKPFLIDRIGDYKILLNVDLHTAYGKRGKMHLFLDKPDDADVLRGIEKVFKGVQIDWGSSDDFYTINGEYIGWANSLVPDVLCLPMLFEFGTMDSQETFGSLKSIQVMINENQGVHYGYKNRKNEIKTKYLFNEMYYPSSLVWRSKAISDAYKMMTEMMGNYERISFD
ncbi:MAG: DUF2817 domain-containing protein [Bacteroidales bacterium]|nr:DUF2817 domain-containing protein [Bacteroidales bacterium]